MGVPCGSSVISGIFKNKATSYIIGLRPLASACSSKQKPPKFTGIPQSALWFVGLASGSERPFSEEPEALYVLVPVTLLAFGHSIYPRGLPCAVLSKLCWGCALFLVCAGAFQWPAGNSMGVNEVTQNTNGT